MKMKVVSRIFFLLLVSLIFSGCKKPGFPVPPASTVPLFSYIVGNNGFAPATVTFTNESIVPETVGTASFSWDFGDGAVSTDASPIHLFGSSGVFPVTLVVKTTISMEIKDLTKNIIIKNSTTTGIPAYFTDGIKVYSGFLNSDPPMFSAFSSPTLGDSYGLAIDTINSKLYISDATGKKILRCDLDGSNLIDFRTGLLGPDGLAIDYAANKLYWDTDDGIQRADMSNTDVNQKEDFVSGKAADDPEGVSIDAAHGKVYWNTYNGGVWMKNIDGTSETKILTTDGGGATLVIGNKLYFDWWIASGDIRLKSADLDGTNVGEIAAGITKLVYGLAYDPAGKKIYWCDRNAYKIMRSDLDGSNIEAWYNGVSIKPRGIVFGKKK